MQEGWSNIPRTSFTIHNLAYQGIFPAAQYGLTNLPLDYFNPNSVEFFGSLNCLKAGIVHADAVTTVSPRYAREITTPEMGCGLDDMLRRRQASLSGILNGVDYEEWDTTRNPHLPYPYSVRSLAAGKAGGHCFAVQKELSTCVLTSERRCLEPSRGSRIRKVWTSNSWRWRKCSAQICNLSCSAVARRFC